VGWRVAGWPCSAQSGRARPVACGLSSSLGGLIAARAVLGLGEAAPFPAMTRVIADWTPPTRRSFVQGLTHSFVSIARR